MTMPLPIGMTTQLREVTIIDIDDVAKIAACRDSFGMPYRISTFLLRYKGAAPAVGERWLVDKLYGTWTFAFFIGVQPGPGTDGEQGPPGDAGGLSATYVFSNVTSFSDPGNGKMRFDTASTDTMTFIYLDDVDVNGVNMRSAFAQAFSLAANPTGFFKIAKEDDPSIFMVGNLVNDTLFTGFSGIEVNVTARSSTAPFNDADRVVISMTRNGDNASNFVFDQDVASDLWEIEHDLGYFPNVTIVDTDGREVEADIVYIDENNITVGFATPHTGRAFLS